MPSSCPKFSPIHAASFVGSHLLNISRVYARGQVLQKCCKYLRVFFHVYVSQGALISKVTLLIKIHLSVCVMRSILDWITGLRRKDIRLCKEYISYFTYDIIYEIIYHYDIIYDIIINIIFKDLSTNIMSDIIYDIIKCMISYMISYKFP